MIHPGRGKLGHLTYLWDPQNLGHQVGPECPAHQQPLGRNEHSESGPSVWLSAQPGGIICVCGEGTLLTLLVISDPFGASMRPQVTKTPSVSTPEPSHSTKSGTQ